MKDARTVGQRQHDALLDLLEFAQRADDAPSNNGVSMTVVVTMTYEQYLTGEGLCRTGHGALVPVKDALTWSGGDYELLAVAINSMKSITHYGTTHCVASPALSLVGSSQQWLQSRRCHQLPADRSVRYEHGGRTTVTNGGLSCHYHHREANRLGWTHIMHNGRPHWTPPTWIDPEQRPVRNTLHDTNPAA